MRGDTPFSELSWTGQNGRKEDTRKTQKNVNRLVNDGRIQ